MHTNRRGFIRAFGIGLVACGSAAPAWAQRLRVLGAAGPVEDVGRRDEGSPEVQRFLSTLRVEKADGFEGLRVFWLAGGAPASTPGVATLDEARSREQLVISERDQASVPEVVADNRGKAPVLVLGGEILVGGKQNRVLIEDVLLPAQSGPRRLAVYCVEHGRWSGRSQAFDGRGGVAAPTLRKKAMARAGQAMVWAEVDQYAQSMQAPSPTQSYEAIHDKREVREYLDAAARALAAAIPAEVQGAAAFVGRTLVGLDCFADSDLFRREWPKLLRAHAVEAYRRVPAEAADSADLRGRAEVLLRDSAAAKGAWRPTPGTGKLFEFRPDPLRGSALVIDGGVLHLAML